MLPVQRRYLVIEHGIVPVVINVVLNGVIAWVMFGDRSSVWVWGVDGLAGDVIATTLLLPALLCLIATPMARRQVRAGKVPPLRWNRREHPLIDWLPRRTRTRALTLGAAATLTIAPTTLAILAAANIDALSVDAFLAFKALFAGVLATVVGPVVGINAIYQPVSDERPF